MKYPMLLLVMLISLTGICQTKKLIIHFTFNSTEITADEKEKLDSFMSSAEKLPMIISGHTDSKGSNAYNTALSQRRADAVKNYLIAKGYDNFGDENAFGETMPLLDDEGDENKGAANRRVEIVQSFPVENKMPAAAEKSVTAAPPAPTRSIEELIEDTATKAGTALVFENLQFLGGMHRMMPASLPVLQSLLTAMKKNPNLKIAVEGHVCCLPGDNDGVDFDTNTEDLSYERAKAVRDYLIYSGIDKKRITFKGFGHTKPLFPFPEENEDQKTANRRVEIRILNK